MENLKALKILKEHKYSLDCLIRTDVVSHLLKQTNEAIKELKALENRSCSNCKYNKEQDNFMIFCDAVMCQDESKMMWHSYTKDFCCNKWESK